MTTENDLSGIPETFVNLATGLLAEATRLAGASRATLFTPEGKSLYRAVAAETETTCLTEVGASSETGSAFCYRAAATFADNARGELSPSGHSLYFPLHDHGEKRGVLRLEGSASRDALSPSILQAIEFLGVSAARIMGLNAR